MATEDGNEKQKKQAERRNLPLPCSLDEIFSRLLRAVHETAASRGDTPETVARELLKVPFPYVPRSAWRDAGLTPDTDEYHQLRGLLAAWLYEGSRQDIARARKFGGRKPESFGPLKKLVLKKVKALRKSGEHVRKIAPGPIWEEFRSNPPRGFEFSGTAGKASASVWVKVQKKNIPYKRFANIVGEVKKQLGLSKKRRKIPE